MERRDVILIAILAVSLALLCLSAYAVATGGERGQAIADQIRAVSEKGGYIRTASTGFEFYKDSGYEIVDVGKDHVTIKAGSESICLPYGSIDFIEVHNAFRRPRLHGSGPGCGDHEALSRTQLDLALRTSRIGGDEDTLESILVCVSVTAASALLESFEDACVLAHILLDPLADLAVLSPPPE
ncbi:MAG: hypothetical protein IKR86_08570 [Candidatus Methanomethylophilaceae archaeon]|nr:hypothetical protein [Candidatus Methanomethylophilaceae archaeon]MBR6038302.1 hypothetical protein [Candidatus Methanomethylophilaceae archaeon]